MAKEPHPQLLAAVFADPDNPAPRLAYAAAEEARDEEHAKFIRDSVSGRGVSYTVLHRRRMDWLFGRPEGDGVWWDFNRGLPENITFNSFTAFAKHGRRAFDFPFLSVRFSALRSMPRLADSPLLAEVRSLSFHGCNLTTEDVRRLAASPYVGNLTHLDLRGVRLSDEGLALIAGSPSLSRLVRLEVGVTQANGSATAAGARALAESPHLSNLRRLDLSGATVGDAGIAAMASSPNLSGLTHLNMNLCAVGAEGMRAVAERSPWPGLQLLNLARNRLTDDGVVALASCSHWSLQTLELGGCRVGDRGAEALARCPSLRTLTRLSLNGNLVGDAGATALAASPYLAAVTILDLGYNTVNDEGGLSLGRSAALRSLTQLQIQQNPMRQPLNAAVVARFATGDLAGVERVATPPEIVIRPAAATAEPKYTGPFDEGALLDGMADDPDDELVKAAYADWLEEAGRGEEAELVRIGLAKPPTQTGHTARETELNRILAKRFEKTLGPLVNTQRYANGLAWVSMFPRSLLSKAFAQTAEKAFRDARVHTLDLDGTTKKWDEVMASPAFGWVRSLHLSRCHFGLDGMRGLVKSPHVGGLTELRLASARLNPAMAAELFTSGSFGRLRALDLGDNFFRADSIRALIHWPQAEHLRVLHLESNFIQSAELSLLLSTHVFAGLRHLSLSSNYYLGSQGAIILAGSPALSNLTRLSLNYTNLNDEGVVALSQSPYLSGLRHLDLGGNSFTEEGVRAVLDAPTFSRLRSLRLRTYNLPAPLKKEVEDRFAGRLAAW